MYFMLRRFINGKGGSTNRWSEGSRPKESLCNHESCGPIGGIWSVAKFQLFIRDWNTTHNIYVELMEFYLIYGNKH